MSHILREVERPGSKLHKKELVEPVTIVETPPMVVVGLVGYVATGRGNRSYKTVWAQHLDESVKRRFYRNYFKSKKAAFRRHHASWDEKKVKADLDDIKKHCAVVRAIAHSQPKKAGCNNRNGVSKAHLLEIQINGGKDAAAKVDFAWSLLEKEIHVDACFAANQVLDTVSITKGRGTQGVVTRWGVSRLPRKSHRGLRKVGCIGAWHPAAVQWTVPRSGQMGYHHRTEVNKKIYKVGKKGEASHGAATEFDMTEKARPNREVWTSGPSLLFICTVLFPGGGATARRWDVTRCHTLMRVGGAVRTPREPDPSLVRATYPLAAVAAAAPPPSMCSHPLFPPSAFPHPRTSRPWVGSPSTASSRRITLSSRVQSQAPVSAPSRCASPCSSQHPASSTKRSHSSSSTRRPSLARVASRRRGRRPRPTAGPRRTEVAGRTDERKEKGKQNAPPPGLSSHVLVPCRFHFLAPSATARHPTAGPP